MCTHFGSTTHVFASFKVKSFYDNTISQLNLNSVEYVRVEYHEAKSKFTKEKGPKNLQCSWQHCSLDGVKHFEWHGGRSLFLKLYKNFQIKGAENF
jgi:hypothetical protein